jgi:superfamily II DNA or RNA helicase
MSLKGKFSNDFTPRIRDRGFAYFRSNAVEILEHSESHVVARVRGSRKYLVSLTLAQASLNVACTCPYFEKGEECKHIWATMLAADNKNYLAEVNLRTRVNLVYEHNALAALLDQNEQNPDSIYEAYSQADPSPALPLFLSEDPSATSAASEPPWRRQLSLITKTVRSNLTDELREWPSGREIFYVIDPESTRTSGKLTVEIGYRERKMKGEWGKIKSKRIPLEVIPALKDTADQQILAILSGARDLYWSSYDYGYSNSSLSPRFGLSTIQQEIVLPLMCATGRCVLRSPDKKAEMQVIEWDDGPAWEFWLALRLDQATNEYTLRPVFRRDSEEIKFPSVILKTEAIVISADCRAARFNLAGARIWMDALGKSGEFRIPVADSDELVAQLLDLPTTPRLDLPEELQFERVSLSSTPHLVVRKSPYAYSTQTQLDADLLFEYPGMTINCLDKRKGVYEQNARRFLQRDPVEEESALELLKTLGVRRTQDYNNNKKFALSSKNLPRVVSTLLGRGWKVEAEGKLYRKPGSSSLSVSSGIDWFELHGSLDYGDGLMAKLPAILTALKRGESMIPLGDGSFGLMPEEWLQQYGLLASLGVTDGDHLRFKRTQTGVLDALLASRPEISCDEAFARVREEWQNFKGIGAIVEPRGFIGTLRDYQREGLGWFEFLQRFGFGGCLADDMGLGKTVQVLALLESRRNGKKNRNGAGQKSVQGSAKSAKSRGLPSLVVVPRSLIFNWQQEAARFTPALRLLTHTGADRTKGSTHFENYDLVITTYGTLRRDALDFQEAEFDFVILDEAQAIKNASTESAKAARLLKGKHRLALSGTPIENHLGELWSLFEFLNPGMLGTASVFQLSTTGARAPDEESRTMLARALRPFLLRRTKQQVAKELPEKLEQTIYCEMAGAQRRQYDELRDYYRASLLDSVERLGIKRAKIQILEALLRLRQTACHPALVTGAVADEESSAKLDVLLPQLSEVTEEGHKALVFSQFTSFLAIVRRRLETEGIDYEYLDGKTRNRGAAVERFQNDPKCKLFLISLKAGGQGLNLTAAEYVFLLDPWWNPAVEAQAIDRAHRIGQARRVFAYRLITRDTVEEKVLALQATKRELADAIINADNSLIRNITGEDLRLLLS